VAAKFICPGIKDNITEGLMFLSQLPHKIAYGGAFLYVFLQNQMS
jgi:hypothetical protein